MTQTLATLQTRARDGINAPPVQVEVHLSAGLPAFTIVGLPETAVRESRDRVRSAIINSGFEFPMRRITVNLAPADLPKDGGRYDLPIALGILAAGAQIRSELLPVTEFIGELALSGELRKVQGVLPVALACQQADHRLILPSGNAREAALVEDLQVQHAQHLLQVCQHLNGLQALPEAKPDKHSENIKPAAINLNHVKGQQQAKRALQIAAAGGHNLLMIGPPGTGKTLLAQCMPSLLPRMSAREAMQTASIHSISQCGFHAESWRQRPFRSPHHSSSGIALVGGGGHPRPGEVSLAHNGVLFLDELPEFERKALEALREPLENGQITISRAGHQASFPARFQLLAAMNPCPCGYAGDTQSNRCHCSQEQIHRYRMRISGPLLDRIDLHIDVPRVDADVLLENSEQAAKADNSAQQIAESHARQLQRQEKNNASLSAAEIDQYCALNDSERNFIRQAMRKLQLSARAYHRILKVARTLADFEAVEQIQHKHLAEAIGFRCLDRQFS